MESKNGFGRGLAIVTIAATMALAGADLGPGGDALAQDGGATGVIAGRRDGGPGATCRRCE